MFVSVALLKLSPNVPAPVAVVSVWIFVSHHVGLFVVLLFYAMYNPPFSIPECRSRRRLLLFVH